LTPGAGILAGTFARRRALGCGRHRLLAIRRQGIYFAMITLALAQMVFFFACRRRSPAARTASRRCRAAPVRADRPVEHDGMYYFVLCIFLFGFLLIYRIVHSPFGQVLKAIRENEPRAISLGYDTDRYKHLAFVLSAALAGLAGATKASCSSSPR
jgi:branched-chain amino acid transport system permease protein